MIWENNYLPETIKDLKKLDGSQRKLVRKAIEKVSKNSLPNYENGYGKSFGNKQGNDLLDFLKIKLRNAELRIIYQVVKINGIMTIIVIGQERI